MERTPIAIDNLDNCKEKEASRGDTCVIAFFFLAVLSGPLIVSFLNINALFSSNSPFTILPEIFTFASLRPSEESPQPPPHPCPTAALKRELGVDCRRNINSSQ